MEKLKKLIHRRFKGIDAKTAYTYGIIALSEALFILLVIVSLKK